MELYLKFGINKENYSISNLCINCILYILNLEKNWICDNEVVLCNF